MNKIIRLKNQDGDKPSLMVQGDKLIMVGTINHMDKIQVMDDYSLSRLYDFISEQLNKGE